MSEVQIDVHALIAGQGVELMWQAMPTVFGAYLNEGPGAIGIIINSGLPEASRRHTAAHELGHHVLGHSTAIEGGDVLDFGRVGDAMPRGSKVWTQPEMDAEAFAAWLLMPRRLVRAGLTRLGMERVERRHDAYRLALLLGVPYRTLLRHLAVLRMLTSHEERRLAAVPPGRTKRDVDDGFAVPASGVGDVWDISDGLAGTLLTAFPGDRLVLPTSARPGSGAHEAFSSVRAHRPKNRICLEVETEFEPGVREFVFAPAGRRAWVLRVDLKHRPRGIYERERHA